MIEITSKQLLTTPLMRVLQKLSQMPVFDGTTAYRIHKIGGSVVTHLNSTQLAFNALGDKYAKRDEHGNVERDGMGRHIPTDDKKEAYAEELGEMLATTYKIPHHKVHVSSLSAQFSPEEIAALEPMLDGLELDESVPSLSAVK